MVLWEGWQKDVVKELYGEISYSEIAKKVDKTPSQVKSWRKRNIPSNCTAGASRFSRKERQYNVNDNFFSERSLVSVYWAGFIAADGCIIRNKKQDLLRIMLQGRDVGHLERFKSVCGFEGNIKTGIVKKDNEAYKKKEYSVCCLSITSGQLSEDLERMYGVVPNKSLTYCPPINLTFEEKKWFIKGYIDGDGSVEKVPEAGKWSARVQILGTLAMVNFIYDFCENGLGIKLPERAVTERKNIHSFTITNKNSMQLLRTLSEIPEGLPRKWAGIAEASAFYKDPRRKLTQDDICTILLRLSEGHLQKDIAIDYGVQQMTISNVKRGKGRARFVRVMEGLETVENVEDIS